MGPPGEDEAVLPSESPSPSLNVNEVSAPAYPIAVVVAAVEPLLGAIGNTE